MACGAAAAAATGWKIGARAGAKRLALMKALASPEAEFLSIFSNCRGTGPERLHKAINSFQKTPRGKSLKLKALQNEDMDFLKKVADRDGGHADGNITDLEAGFAFRVWMGFNELRDHIEGIFDTLDNDGSGELDTEELQGYLVQLNDGCPVLYEEVEYVMNYVDCNGDGGLDKKELMFATSIWYCSIVDEESPTRLSVGQSSKSSRSTRVTQRMSGRCLMSDLKVTIVDCSCLRNADGFVGGCSDPYVSCKILGTKKEAFRTSVIHNDLNPVWNHEAIIRDYQVGDSIEFSVWDRDFLKGPDLLGRVVLEASEFYPHGFAGTRLLRDAGSGEGKARIQLRVSTFEDEESASFVLGDKEAVRKRDLASISTTATDLEGLDVWPPMSSEHVEHAEPPCVVLAEPRLQASRPAPTAEDLAYPGPAGVREPPLSGPDVSPLMVW